MLVEQKQYDEYISFDLIFEINMQNCHGNTIGVLEKMVLKLVVAHEIPKIVLLPFNFMNNQVLQGYLV